MPPTRTQLRLPERRARLETESDALRRAGSASAIHFCFVLWLFCLMPGSVAAGAAPEPEHGYVRHAFVAGQDVALPVLPGFEEVLGRSAEFDRLMSKFVLPDNRMLGFYISAEDMARMSEGAGDGFRRYVIVQTLKQGIFLEEDGRFDAVKTSFREEMASLPAQSLSDFGDVMQGAAEYIGETYKTDMKMKISESRSQGAFAETEDYIGFLNLSSLAVETGAGEKSYPSAVALMAVRVRDRLILVYSYYSNYETSADVDMAKETALFYVERLLELNEKMAEASRKEGGGGRMFLLAALCGVVFLVLARLISARGRLGK
jgi:hypothetical protein